MLSAGENSEDSDKGLSKGRSQSIDTQRSCHLWCCSASTAVSPGLYRSTEVGHLAHREVESRVGWRMWREGGRASGWES